jgi:hypothetical protein
LQNSFLFHAQPFLVKRATETVDNNRNYYRAMLLIICAVPLRTGLKDFVVPWKSNTQPSLSAILMFSSHSGLRLFINDILSFTRQVRSTVIAPP